MQQQQKKLDGDTNEQSRSNISLFEVWLAYAYTDTVE